MRQIFLKLSVLGFALIFVDGAIAQTDDVLPSWNEGKAKQAIIQFVKNVSTVGGSKFVPQAERIAAFGNSDGDLQMLQWTAAGEGARFYLYVHHINK